MRQVEKNEHELGFGLFWEVSCFSVEFGLLNDCRISWSTFDDVVTAARLGRRPCFFERHFRSGDPNSAYKTRTRFVNRRKPRH